MKTLRFFAIPGVAKTMVENFSSLAGVTGARLVATNVLNQTTTISGGASVVGNNIYITVPASYNIVENYPATFSVETTTNGTTWVQVLILNGVLRYTAAAPAVPDFGTTIASAFNKTGAANIFANNPTNTIISGLGIVIPPTTKDVWVEWAITVGIQTAGAGYVLTKLYDITSGPVQIEGAVTRIDASQVVTTAADVQFGKARVGPSTVARQFGLYGSTIQDAGSSLVAYARNLNNSVSCSWMRAAA